MTKPAMATMTAAIMSRSLPGCAIRVMFTEVSFPGVPGACAGARLRGYKAVTSADRSARGWFLGQPFVRHVLRRRQDAALVGCRVTSHDLSLRLEPSGGYPQAYCISRRGTRPAGDIRHTGSVRQARALRLVRCCCPVACTGCQGFEG